MTTTRTIPPQAYTRETLIRAYEWLGNQGPAIRERATSADNLVAMYLQAKRRTNGQELMDSEITNWETPSPASVEAFKAELKQLSEGLKQFEGPPVAPPQPTAPVMSPPITGPVAATYSPALAPALTPLPTPAEPAVGLDARSQQLVREAQYKLNLSSEAEALRALIALGAERLKP